MDRVKEGAAGVTEPRDVDNHAAVAKAKAADVLCLRLAARAYGKPVHWGHGFDDLPVRRERLFTDVAHLLELPSNQLSGCNPECRGRLAAPGQTNRHFGVSVSEELDAPVVPALIHAAHHVLQRDNLRGVGRVQVQLRKRKKKTKKGGRERK